MTAPGQCPRGGGGAWECLHPPPPPFMKSCIRAWYLQSSFERVFCGWGGIQWRRKGGAGGKGAPLKKLVGVSVYGFCAHTNTPPPQLRTACNASSPDCD